jgi:outer membrane protein assembly factor BamB
VDACAAARSARICGVVTRLSVCDRGGMTRRGLVILFGAIVAAIGAAIVAWGFMVPTRFIYGVVAAGPGEALLLTRRNEDRATYFWLERVDLAGHRWTAALTPLEPDESLGFSSVAVDDDRVVLLGVQPDGDVAAALDRATGDRLWTTTLPAAPSTDSRIGPTVVFDGPRVVLVRGIRGADAPAIQIDVLAVADGGLLWSHAPGSDGDVQRIAADRLLVTSRGEDAVVLAGDTGAVVARVPGAWVRCPLPAGALLSGRDGITVVGADAPRRLAADPQWRPAGGPCGARDGDLVVAGRRASDDAAVLVRLDPVTGAARWQVDLGQQQLEETLSLDGRLPRFLPVTMFGGDAAGVVNALAIVDLDAGTVIRQAVVQEHTAVVVTGERAWMWAPFRGVLVGFDPATGAFAALTRFKGTYSSDLTRDDLRFGELWLYGMDWGGPGALPWVSVDLADARAPRLSGTVVIEAVSPAERAALGG